MKDPEKTLRKNELDAVTGGDALYMKDTGCGSFMQKCSDPACVNRIWMKADHPAGKCPVCGAQMETRPL